MALRTVQTYEVNSDGVLSVIPNFVFQTDTSGSAVLGGCASIIDITKNPVFTNARGDFIDYIGAPQPVGYPYGPNIRGTASAISAGICNTIKDAQLSFIGGGQENLISGGTTTRYCSASCGGAPIPIGGGLFGRPGYGTPSFVNLENGNQSFIGGGTCNSILSSKSVIVGGHSNTIRGVSKYLHLPYNPSQSVQFPLDISGEFNTGIGWYNSINGMNLSEIQNGPGWNAIVGGNKNDIDGILSFVGAGYNNNIISDKQVVSTYTPGGYFSFIHQSSGQYDVIVGGKNNSICNTCFGGVLGGDLNTINISHNSTILGGKSNIISNSGWSPTSLSNNGNCSVIYNSILGGLCNQILSNAFSIIGGGNCNKIFSNGGAMFGRDTYEQFYSANTILNGLCNSISGEYNTIGGGCKNFIYGENSFINGGSDNILSGSYSSILAGKNNKIINKDNVLILGGNNISAVHDGSTLITDSSDRSKSSVRENTLLIDFASGIILRTNPPNSSQSIGYSGQVALDKNYFYTHNGENWVRTAMSSW